ncbi:Protein basic pentacysteine 7 [Apostasia shenzhenica]|uniref:GAGA-binding transcriptional activator n=1 Tax=Apostasia shenzhenica TaxID=1088818 RepID=A0A2I0ACJ6_9ASPA|nr:Protein basic pentacysteine 7 [Apostasia shenzhenica]
MDGKGRLNTRNWEFMDHRLSESMLKPTLGVSIPENNVSGYQASFLKIGAYSDRSTVIGEHHSEASSMNFSWVPQRNFLQPAKAINHLHATSAPLSSEMINVPSIPISTENAVQNGPIDAKPIKSRKQSSSAKKANRIATKVLRPKEPKKPPSGATRKKVGSTSMGKREKKSQENSFDGIMIDFSGVPVPVCSCTGVPRQCYRWGTGGWQSSCCTTNISEYPLPMSLSRPGARLAGRKMSIGAYGKLLQRLAVEGHDLSYAVDLKNHWARHGTNKFVTIK